VASFARRSFSARGSRRTDRPVEDVDSGPVGAGPATFFVRDQERKEALAVEKADLKRSSSGTSRERARVERR
jgi:hypothetical protein